MPRLLSPSNICTHPVTYLLVFKNTFEWFGVSASLLTAESKEKHPLQTPPQVQRQAEQPLAFWAARGLLRAEMPTAAIVLPMWEKYSARS